MSKKVNYKKDLFASEYRKTLLTTIINNSNSPIICYVSNAGFIDLNINNMSFCFNYYMNELSIASNFKGIRFNKIDIHQMANILTALLG